MENSSLPAGTASDSDLGLSVVIPFFNEAGNVTPLLHDLWLVTGSLDVGVEVLAIDDGSEDGTPAELAAAAQVWPAVRVVRFERNRGQAAALWRGFKAARGRWIGLLDGDGQNPPAELGRLWALRHSADMIAGARVERRDPQLRRAMSRVANVVRRAALRDGVSDTGCSLKLFRREVAECFLPLRTMYSFLPAFAVAAGWTVREVPVAHRPRRAGVSHYGLGKMAVRPLRDLVVVCWRLRQLRQQSAAMPLARS